MRRFLLGGVVTSALFVVSAWGPNAEAAKQHIKVPAIAAPPQPTVYNWSGFYTGLNTGAAWSSYDPQTSTNHDGAIGASTDLVNAFGKQSIRPLGFIGGSQVGYNWQSAHWVAGIEGDINYLHLNGAASTAVPLLPPSTATAVISAYGNVHWLVTMRPRVGWAADNWLFFVTGGIAVTGFNDDFALSGDNANGTIFYQQSGRLDNLPIGYAAGGGIERAITDRWSVKGEYLHVGFGRVTATQTATNVPTQLTIQSADLKADIVRFGLNYRWGGADSTPANTDSGPAMPMKAPPLTSPIWKKSDWEFDVGIRA